ncbi:hypothetical protein OC846_005371 [Tilletia horrida]|uniref:Uncharacterized protein n=1 Tax=Tilletia horrida TaxID=155126 RepID=A0AAN6GLI7_9BASI|nr:hypothetical protein OC846_005371 [Tilletia horrida]KAK0549416.1 hypothetical protein OC845_003121 [Tilletia horrida]
MQIFLLLTFVAAVSARLGSGSNRANPSVHKRMGLTNLRFDTIKTGDLKADTGNFAHALTGKVWQLGTVSGNVSHSWTPGALRGRYHTEVADNGAKAIGHWTFDDKIVTGSANLHLKETFLRAQSTLTGSTGKAKLMFSGSGPISCKQDKSDPEENPNAWTCTMG